MDRLPECVECPRLTLRRWLPDDARRLADAVGASLHHLRPWMDWADDEPIGLDERRDLITGWQAEWEAGTDAVYGAFLGETVVGGCGLHRRDTTDTLHIGYWVHVDHVRRGYAREIAAALATAGFGVPGIARIEIHHAPGNIASASIPESLGFTPEPTDGADVVRWVIDADAWGERHGG